MRLLSSSSSSSSLVSEVLLRLRNRVLYQDEHIFCVNKWLGVAVQGGANSIAYALANNPNPTEKKKKTLKNTSSYRIVHRLDVDTTGVLCIAKTERAAQRLNYLFENQLVEKTYYAITIGSPYPASGNIVDPIGRLPGSSQYHAATTDEDLRLLSAVKPCETSYQVLEENGHHAALVKLMPHTGRRHQLRIHLAQSLQTPILGDSVYGVQHQDTPPFVAKALFFRGSQRKDPIPLCLHAQSLKIPNYRDVFSDIGAVPSRASKDLVVETKRLPRHFQRAIDCLDLIE